MVYPSNNYLTPTDYICTAVHHEYQIKQVSYKLNDENWF